MSEQLETDRKVPGFGEYPLSFFSCPNGECADFGQFGNGNLAVVEHIGKDKTIRRFRCKTCGTRFSERKGSLMEYCKLPLPEVVRIVKCLTHGCSVEATADICEVDTRTVQRIIERGGKRSENFQQLQLDQLSQPLNAVEMDELHGRSIDDKTGSKKKMPLHQSVVQWVVRGATWLWRPKAGM
jgi:transposase-like protein